MVSKAEAELLKNAWREERAARERDRQARAAREADLKASGPMDSGFVENDGALYPILAWAKDDELHLLATILSQKVSSRIDEGCRSPLAIASEIQRMGGNSVVNLLRGHGVGYQEIVLDVAEKIGVDKHILSRTGNSVASMEMEIVELLFARLAEKLPESARAHLASQLAGAADHTRHSLLAQAVLPALLREFDWQGVVELAFIIAAGRAVAAWVPVVGWLSAGAGALLELSATAYSVTIPCVVVVGSIRARLREAEQHLNG